MGWSDGACAGFKRCRGRQTIHRQPCNPRRALLALSRPTAQAGISRSEMSEPSRQALWKLSWERRFRKVISGCVQSSEARWTSLSPGITQQPAHHASLYNSAQFFHVSRVRGAMPVLLLKMLLDLPTPPRHRTCAAYTNLRLGPACSSSCLRDTSDPDTAGTDWSRLLLMSAVSLDATHACAVATWCSGQQQACKAESRVGQACA